MISFTSLYSLMLGVAQVLANRRKNTLPETKHIEPSQNEQYCNFSLVISRHREEQACNRPR